MRSVITRVAAVLAFTSLTVTPAIARPANVKQAKDAGVQDVKCSPCHASAKPPTKDTFKEAELTPAGKWMLEQKTKQNAKESNGAWLKEYPGPK